MAVIYLIRHGQASFGKEDYDVLSSLGVEQAELLGTTLKARYGASSLTSNGSALVFSGTMKRHHQTRDYTGLGIESGFRTQELSAWNEYDHQEILGKLDIRLATAAGTREMLKQAKDPKAAFADCFSKATARWQSGDYQDYTESWQTFKSRVLQGLDTVFAELQQQDKKIAFVFTSGGPISVVVQQLLGLADEQLLSINWTLVNCGITKVVATKNRVLLSTLNDHSHFDYPDTQQFITYK